MRSRSQNVHVDHIGERDAVAFQIVDRSSGDGAQGPYGADWPGVMRPLLRWICQTVLEYQTVLE
jgi:hypothetical protein